MYVLLHYEVSFILNSTAYYSIKLKIRSEVNRNNLCVNVHGTVIPRPDQGSARPWALDRREAPVFTFFLSHPLKWKYVQIVQLLRFWLNKKYPKVQKYFLWRLKNAFDSVKGAFEDPSCHCSHVCAGVFWCVCGGERLAPAWLNRWGQMNQNQGYITCKHNALMQVSNHILTSFEHIQDKGKPQLNA